VTRSYKRTYGLLIAQAHAKGLHVITVKDKKTRDFVGMNSLAAKSFGLKMKPRTVWIDGNMNLKEKCHTLKHELVEYSLMRKGMKYWPAHNIALKEERKLLQRVS